ncbi:hypothetical protein [Acidiluteibacter ferrifornacis]|uniref:DUF2116 family Zn-ribbon domain-containing protein n=1 Tax=Acidiluteibacter ferrifornacis TaxID=2692424 RepID=A0A6N9NNG9_9FLAO|nr:hypothetical protein [Acidiluteibacter ferrifornacis]NBG67419.1 hypothetical protein [Acidiluteibacter ferrifornacis]
MDSIQSCPICSNPIVGRTDKIYCSLECKRASDYEKRKVEEKLFISIDRQLKTNRKILKKYNRVGKTTLRKEELIKEGFNPNYFTHYWKNSNGDIYLFVYDYGFLALKENLKDKYLIVQWQAYMSK